ncbi:MAG TPA: RHS repeat-associated core domain-containing protein [Planctomycetota bacterium]|nr:RHS repeat-associated core domain-containing protein [Planctomycetota bacterium]
MRSSYEARRRLAPVVYGLAVLLALPPAFMPAALAVTNRRINTFSRDSKLETLRNPQFSSAASNRFLFTQGPQALVGSGGDDFSNPDSRGYGSLAEPAAHWISYKGRLEWTDNDLMLPGVGLPLIFQRIYRGSVSSYAGPLGSEWEFNWNKRIKYDTSGSPTKALFYEEGRRDEYTLSGSTYTSPIGRYDVLTRTATPEYWRTDREGVKEVYERDSSDNTWFRLKTMTDLNGNRLSCSYDSNSRLTKVRDTLDQDTTLAFDSNDRITKITDPASREWVYAYDSGGHLTTVRTPTVDETGTDDDYTSGKTTTYKYDGSGQLTEVVRPGDGATGKWKWAYDASGFITKETRAGNDLTLTYDTTNKKVTVVDRESNKTVYFWDDGHEGNLITKRDVYYDASNYYETTYAYDAAGNVTSVIFPLGNRVLYTFDGSGNVLSVSFKKDAGDGSPKVWTYTWATNARLSTLTDPNGSTWDYDYDGNGNLITKTAPAVTWPNSTHGTIRDIYLVNSSGQVTRHTDPLSKHTDTSYTTVNSKSAFPNVVTRDSGGLNLTTDYDYNSIGQVTQVKDANNNATVYTVNALDQVILAVEPGSVSKTTHFDANDRVTKTEVSNDTTVGDSWFVVDRDFDVQDNLTRVREDLTNASRITRTYAFDKDDRLTLATSPEGNQTQTAYDVRDLVASVTRKAASSADDAITSTTYDSNGNRVTVTNPRGYNTLYLYDGYDRLTKTTDPEGHYVTLTYDAAGNVISRQHYNSGNTLLAQTVYAFDQANRLYQTDELAKKADLSTNLGDGVRTNTLILDERSAVLSHSGDVCGCSLWTHTYDAVGREITRQDPLGSDPTILISDYDKNGNVTKVTRKDQSQDTGIEADKDVITEYVYDARNHRTTMKERLDVSTTMDTVYSYGLRDQLTKVVDGNGDEKRFEHNEQLWKTKEIAECGATDPTTEYTYDSDGRLVTYRAKNSTTGDQDTLYTYDKLDRVVTTQWPPNPSTAEKTLQTFDKSGNRISTTDPNGTVSVCAYDKNDRLTSRTNTLATNVVGATSLTFGYDGLGRLVSADTSENGAYTTGIDRTWNTLGKMETEVQVLDGYASGAGRTISYVYDVKGNVLSKLYPVSGNTIHYSLDALDRVDKISRGSSQVVDFTWSGPRMIKKTYPGSYETRTYDGYGRISDIHAFDTSSGHTLDEFTYGYDASSQITAWDRFYYDDVQNTRITGDVRDEGAQYKYDGAKRLITALRGVATAYITDPMATNLSLTHYRGNGAFNYDQTGNRVTRQLDGTDDQTFTHDKANQISTEGGSAVSSDQNGNYTGASNALQYTWNNQWGRYIQAGSPAITHTWHYDALGRRVQWDGGARTYRYYFDGDELIEHVEWLSSTETSRKQYVFNPGRIDDLVMYEYQVPNPDVQYYAHTDHLGSVANLVEADGDIAEGYRYLEWGQTTIVNSSFVKLSAMESPSIKNNVRFAGRDEYTVLGTVDDTWYNNRARAYRSGWGRFVQRDPSFSSILPNPYVYASLTPLHFIDPSGGTVLGPDHPGEKHPPFWPPLFHDEPPPPGDPPPGYEECFKKCKQFENPEGQLCKDSAIIAYNNALADCTYQATLDCQDKHGGFGDGPGGVVMSGTSKKEYAICISEVPIKAYNCAVKKGYDQLVDCCHYRCKDKFHLPHQ